jgi:hypothetical protein
VAAFYDETRLEQCTTFDTQFVSPVIPTYYHEDEWEDEASEGAVSEFVLHYALESLWLFQFMRSQNTHGRKTITLVAVPTVDGDGSVATLGMVSGTLSAATIYWPTTAGLPVAAMSTETNLTLFYKAFDLLPEDPADAIVWNDVLGILYSMRMMSTTVTGPGSMISFREAWPTLLGAWPSMRGEGSA